MVGPYRALTLWGVSSASWGETLCKKIGTLKR